MSKTIEDYREIVKVLKLQLLKVRQQNNSLSKTLGIATQSESSSFSPRLEKLKNNGKQFAKHMYLYNLFGHKCELIGVTPEMVFRIADKKRDKKVSVSDLTEIMKRLKLKFADTEIYRLLQSITKSNSVYYDEYLQYINAFQINSETYPPNSQRTFSQKSLIKFGLEAKEKDISIENLYRQISNKEGGPNISFQAFSSYCKNKTKLKDSQIICIFVTLDASSDCCIQRDNFMREMNKITILVDRGISLDQDKQDELSQQNDRKRNNNKGKSKDDNDDFSIEVDTGVQKGQVKKQPKKETKLSKGDLNKLIQELKKQGISTNNLVSKLLQKEEKRKLIRPFNLNDFCKIIQQISKANKKKIMQFFKCLDTSYNGSISTDELVKLWLQGKQVSDPDKTLFNLLARHLKEIQIEQFITRFKTSEFKQEDIVDSKAITSVFSALDLKDDYYKMIQSYIPKKITVSRFVELLETGGAPKSKKVFQPMKTIDKKTMQALIEPFVQKQKLLNFPKLSRQEGKSTERNYWETIFIDEWSCWRYCLEKASELKQFWRDPQFGPSKGDPNGYRSIVGNQSQVPPGLPMEDEITWMTFEQMLEKRGQASEQVSLFSKNLVPNDIIQGKVGDCWFVSSLSIITSNDEFVKGKEIKQCKINPETALTYGIHPKIFHFFRQFGMYVFKFFKGFKPIYVVVDDLFPVEISSNELIFAKSPEPGLQWVAFLQKAFAKLHHCYTNLISGDISQGLSDLTNTLPIKQSLNNSQPQELLEKILKLSVQKQLMGCSINSPPGKGVEQPVTLDEERTGLFYGHAYSIGDLIDLQKINKQDFKLLRIRNPWGHGEWMLDWSEKPLNNDPDYQKLDKYLKDIDKFYDQKIQQAKKMKQNYGEIEKYKKGEDGEFLMNFYDFARVFNNLFTGYSLEGKNYNCYTLEGKWDKSMPSGLCKAKGSSDDERKKFVKDNYQFILDVKQKTDIIMFLIQQDGRLYRGQKYPYKQICNGIIILSFNLDNNQKALDKFDNTKLTLPNLKLQLKRETNYWHKFEPGRYAIFPCKAQNKIPETQFQFRMYADKDVAIRKERGPTGDFKMVPKAPKPAATSLQPMVDWLVKIEPGK